MAKARFFRDRKEATIAFTGVSHGQKAMFNDRKAKYEMALIEGLRRNPYIKAKIAKWRIDAFASDLARIELIEKEMTIANGKGGDVVLTPEIVGAFAAKYAGARKFIKFMDELSRRIRQHFD